MRRNGKSRSAVGTMTTLDAKFLLIGRPYMSGLLYFGQRAKDYHGWGDADCERFGRDDRSSLFQRTKIGMVGSRRHYPTATRGSLARTPSHSANNVFRFIVATTRKAILRKVSDA
jgi:hypothetical protein